MIFDMTGSLSLSCRNKHRLSLGIRISEMTWNDSMRLDKKNSSWWDWTNKQVVKEIVNDNTTDYRLFSCQFYSRNYFVSRKLFYCIIRSREHSALGFAAQSLARLFILKLLFEFQKGMDFIPRISILDFTEGSLAKIIVSAGALLAYKSWSEDAWIYIL